MDRDLVCGVQSLVAPADHQHEQFAFTDGEEIRRGISPVPQAHIPALFFQESPGLEISMSYIYVVIPISCVLMGLYLLRDTIRFFKGGEVKHEEIHS